MTSWALPLWKYKNKWHRDQRLCKWMVIQAFQPYWIHGVFSWLLLGWINHPPLACRFGGPSIWMKWFIRTETQCDEDKAQRLQGLRGLQPCTFVWSHWEGSKETPSACHPAVGRTSCVPDVCLYIIPFNSQVNPVRSTSWYFTNKNMRLRDINELVTQAS